jgi:hypothetical protein
MMHPAMMGQAAFGHHLHQVSEAELEAQVPPYAQDDDLAIEVPTSMAGRIRRSPNCTRALTTPLDKI